MSYYAFMLLLAVDYGQTRYIMDSNQYHESNYSIERMGVDRYFGSVALAATGLKLLAPKKSQGFFLYLSGIQLITVTNNYSIGVQVKW